MTLHFELRGQGDVCTYACVRSSSLNVHTCTCTYIQLPIILFLLQDDPMDVVTFVVNSGAHDVLASYVSGALDVKQVRPRIYVWSYVCTCM